MTRRDFFSRCLALATAMALPWKPRPQYRHVSVTFRATSDFPDLHGITWGTFKVVILPGKWMRETVKEAQA